MKILILCNKSPYPPKEGGAIAINMMVEGLIEEGHTVKVLAMSTNKYPTDPADIPLDYKTRTRIEFANVDLSIKPWNAFLNLFSNRSFHVERFISSDYTRRLEEILIHEKFDIVQFEMIYMSPYIEVVNKYSKAKLILRAHNIEHKIWERIAEGEQYLLKKLYLRHLASQLKRYELGILRQYNGIATISEVDAVFFRKTMGADDIPVITIPFGINLKNSIQEISQTPTLSLFSIGAMNWIPNSEGIRWFLDAEIGRAHV